MASTNLLHALQFPDRTVGDGDGTPLSRLYVRTSGPATWHEGSIELAPGSAATFDTYFNCLTVGAWNRSAPLDDVIAEIDVDAPCTVEVWNTDTDGSRKLAAVESPGGSTTIPVPTHDDLTGICWIAVTAGADAVNVRGGGWRTTTPTRRPVRLAVVMTTFRREAYVRRNLDLLDRYAAGGEGRLRDVRVTVVDNGRTPDTRAAGDKEGTGHHFSLDVLPNRNLGGAGGFARGLIAHRDAGWATHVVFTDDDIVLPPEAIDRTVSFLAYASDDRRCLASSMLDESSPTMQYECGAAFHTRRRHPTDLLRYGLDLTDVDALVANSEDQEIGYGGWWFFAFPIGLTDDNPLPVFVRGDDVEFGLSHCADAVEVMNGVGVWHQNFDYKNNPVTFHLEARNHPLVGVLTDPGFGRRHVLNRFGAAALRFLLAMKYSSGEHVLAGMREFVAGPDRWLELDHEAEFARLSADGEERPGPLDDAVLATAEEVENPSAVDVATLLTLGGHLLPRRWSRRPPIVAPIQSRQMGATIGRERVVYFDRPSGSGFVARRDRRRFFAGLADLARTAWDVWWKFPAAAQGYRQRRHELVGTEYWRRQFDGSGGGAG